MPPRAYSKPKGAKMQNVHPVLQEAIRGAIALLPVKQETVNTGGNFMVDLHHLQGGRIIGKSEDCLVVYKSIEQFDSGVDPATGEYVEDNEDVVEL